MKFVKVFLAILAIAVAYEDIDDKYHEVFAVPLFADKQKLWAFLACVIDINPCNTFGQHIKDHMMELLSDGCKECDSTHKHYAHLTIALMIKDYPELYKAFEAKYDPKRNLLKNLMIKRAHT